MVQNTLVHWADLTADRIIKQLGDKDQYVLASGITPSGTVHFGNFREVITVDLVARGLKARGKKVRFIFSWDDYDTFRKIPTNMPKQAMLEQYLFQPIVDTPDPYGEHDSYAAHHEHQFMQQLLKVGIEVEPLFQAQKYRAGEYNQAILLTLKNKNKIRDILDAHRKDPLDEHWWPVSVYCEKCNRDKMHSLSFDGKETVNYTCQLCTHVGSERVPTSQRLKLPWRMDWPMRWAHEKVDFEPGGKDHSSQGGSYSTAKEIVKEVYQWPPPIYLQYDFVSIKGRGGKMSSSKGDLVSVDDVLKVYEPEMVRWIFASYKTNVDFAVSFDLDVIKTYEDYDRMERLAFGAEPGNEKKVEMAKRVFELSQLDTDIPTEMPFQPSFRHLCNLLQIHEGNLEKTHKAYQSEIITARDERRFKQRANCAWNWLTEHAPEDFKFQLNKAPLTQEVSPQQSQFLDQLVTLLQNEWESFQSDKDLHERIYSIMNERELGPTEIFPLLYRLLINKEKGPKLAGFILTIGQQKAIHLLGKT